jgi:lipopolysaccharide export system protein LptA
VRAALAFAVLLAVSRPAFSEKADKDKPTQVEANKMSADETRRLTIFEGNVLITKGTITVRAERIVVRQDAEGYQYTTATGAPVRFRQREDPKDGKEGQWMDGEALRIEIDDRKSTIELHEKARVTRGCDEILGGYIFVDQRSDFFSVTPGKDSPGERVRATLQPKTESAKGSTESSKGSADSPKGSKDSPKGSKDSPKSSAAEPGKPGADCPRK